MELTFNVFAHGSKPVQAVYEAVANAEQLSRYFTTGGAEGRIETGATVMWEFHDFPGAFPVKVVEAVPDQRIVLLWKANDSSAPEGYDTTVMIPFTPVEGDPGRTRVEIREAGWGQTEQGLAASYGNGMGWSQMLAALKVWLEHGINLREGMYV